MMNERECLTWILGFTFGKSSINEYDIQDMHDYIHSTLERVETWKLDEHWEKTRDTTPSQRRKET